MSLLSEVRNVIAELLLLMGRQKSYYGLNVDRNIH